LHVAPLSLSLSHSHRLELDGMGLSEVPTELFCMENVKTLRLNANKLCSLPSDIAHLTMLETLYVRLFDTISIVL
jgi:Leucine-rich repeat (LRR) protein